jgi:dUTP pyrophosphatase
MGSGLSDQVDRASEKPRLSIEKKRIGREWPRSRRLGGFVVAVIGLLAYSQTARPMAPRQIQVNFTRLDRELPIPQTAHPGDAAVDLHSRVDVSLEAGQWASVATGLAVAIPEGHAGLVLPRSGHAAKHGVGVVNGPGLIDSGYRGEISVLLINHGDQPVSFLRGERIAQLAIVPIPTVEWAEVDSLDETRRGSGGFGSTGS